jgi:hypothetical protein
VGTAGAAGPLTMEVAVGVLLGVEDGVLLGVVVSVSDGVLLGVVVRVSDGVLVGVIVDVALGVLVGVPVGSVSTTSMSMNRVRERTVGGNSDPVCP